jgi:putative transposase
MNMATARRDYANDVLSAYCDFELFDRFRALAARSYENGRGAAQLFPLRLLVASDPPMAPARLAAQFKGFTSHQLREEFPWLKSYLPSLWSRSYYIGSIGAISEATVKRYIAEQKSHA